MIRLLFIILFSLLLISETQEKVRQNKHLISSNLMSMVPYNGLGFYNINYQFTQTRYSAIGFGAYLPTNPDDVGYAGEVFYNFYPLTSSPKYLYTGIRMLYSNIENESEQAQAELFSFGVYAGWQIMGKHLSLNFGFGIDYNTGPSLQDKILETGQTNVTPLFIISLGWAWR